MYNSKTTENSKQIYKTGEVKRFYNLTLNGVVNQFSLQFFLFEFPPVSLPG